MDLFELEAPEKITIDVTDICARFVNTLIFIECSKRFSRTHFSSFFRNIEAVDAKMGVILSFIRKFLGYVLYNIHFCLSAFIVNGILLEYNFIEWYVFFSEAAQTKIQKTWRGVGARP